MVQTRKYGASQRGFTLVELMVTVFLTAIAVISIYRGYVAFYQSADAQQQVMEMQQNLRIGMSWLAEDIRRAGMNEEDEDTAGFLPGTNASQVVFSMDLGSANGPVNFASDGEDNDHDGPKDALDEDESRIGDGDTTDDGERIWYFLAPSTVDPSTNNLQRRVYDSALSDFGPAQTVITNVEALDFVYFDSGSASPPAAPAPMTIGAGGLTAAQLDVVSRVEITLVVRTTNEDYRYNDNVEYKNLRNTTLVDKPGDNFRRRAFSMVVKIRNNI